jgi:hypothetical protein
MILELSSGTYVIPDGPFQLKLDDKGYFISYSHNGKYIQIRIEDDDVETVQQLV